MKTLEYIANFFVFQVLFVAPVGLILAGSLLLMNYLDDRQHHSLFFLARIVSAPIVLFVIFGAPYLAHQAAAKRTFAGIGFIDAFEGTWADLRTKLEFLPIIGKGRSR